MAAINAASLEPPSGHRKTKAVAPLAENELSHYIGGVNHLTKQEIYVICVVLGLLVTGWCVKGYRKSHPAATPVQTAKP
jgi:hypothetical protein